MKQTHLPNKIASFWKLIPLLFFAFIFNNNSLHAQSCNDLNISGNNGQISIQGLTAPIEIVDVYDANWQSIFRCDGGNCGSQQTIPNLSAGLYHVNIQFYTAQWQSICNRAVDVNVIGGGGNKPDLSLANLNGVPASAQRGEVKTFTFDLKNTGNATASGAYRIDAYVSKTTNASDFISAGEVNTGNTPVGTIPNVTGAITIPGSATDGSYFLILKADGGNVIDESNENNNQIVGSQKIQISGGGTGGNMIQCGEIKITYGSGSIQMQGQSGNNYFFKVHDLNAGWAEVFSCGYNCGSSQTATGLGNGDYLVRVYNSSWAIICEQEINLTGGGSGCGSNGDNDGDGVCNNADNCRDTFNPDQADSDGDGVGDACDDGGSNGCGFVSNFSNQTQTTFGSTSFEETNNAYKITQVSSDNRLKEVTNLSLDGNVISTQNYEAIATNHPDDFIAIGNGDHYYYLSSDNNVITLTKKNYNQVDLWSKNYTIRNLNFDNISSITVKEFDNDLLISLMYAEVLNNIPSWGNAFIKTDLNGNEIAQGAIDASSEFPQVTIAGKSKDGGYYVTHRFGNQQQILIKTTSSLNEDWRTTMAFDLPSIKPFFIGESPDGSGVYFFIRNYPRYFLVKVNTSNGTDLWRKEVAETFIDPEPFNFAILLNGAVPTADGGLVVSYSYQPIASSGVTGYQYGRLDTNGNVVWVKDTPASIGESIGVPQFETSDGGILFSERNNGQVRIIKTTAAGDLTPDCDGGNTGGNTVQCGEITINYTSNSIAMNGQSGINYNYKIHDLNNGWAEVFSCTYQCGNSQTANNLANGRYLVKIFDESWSVVCEQEINLGASSRNRFSNLETFTIYPNPAQEAIFMDLKEYTGESADIAISNIYGQVVHTRQIADIPMEPFKIQLSNYLNGFYLIHVKMKGKQLRSEKFLVKSLY